MLQNAVMPFERRDPVLADGDAVALELRQLFGLEPRGPIRTEAQTPAPHRQLERQAERAAPLPVDRDGLIAELPAVAVRAVEDALAIQFADAVNLRKVVHHARRDE